MIYLDSVVLNWVEGACRRFQRLTGRSNVWLAVQLTNLSIVVYFVWAGAYFWRAGLTLRVFIGVVCSGVLYVLMQTVFREPIETYENNAYRRIVKGGTNPRRVRDALLRIAFLTLCIFLSYPVAFVYVYAHRQIVLLTYSLILLTTAVLYVLACDPLPPRAVKFREPSKQSVPSRAAAHET